MPIACTFSQPGPEVVRVSRREMLAGLILPAGGALLPPRSPFPSAASPEERFWRAVRAQFPLRPGLVLMNAANLCPCPYATLDRLFELTRDMDTDPSLQNRSKYSSWREEVRSAVASYLGADPQEIALVRNTSEGNNLVVQALDLGPGDEVVIWDQNHPTNEAAWEVRARRHGFRVLRVSTPESPHSPSQLLEPFRQALTSRTRVLAFSHVSNLSGIRLPARDLCRLARSRGILTLVDGAQSAGVLPLNLREMECDFFTTSAHKWLMGPREVGILFVRQGLAESLWPAIVGIGWEAAEKEGARRFETLGQRDDAALAALGETIRWHLQLGPQRIWQRVRQLVLALREGLEKLPGCRLLTPGQEALSAGVLVLRFEGQDPQKLFERLYREHGIAGAAMRGKFAGLRLSPHVYNLREDVEAVLERLGAL